MDKKVFIENRKKVWNNIEDNSIIILFSGAAPKKSADEAYSYTPNRNFYYSCGVDEENDILLISKINGIYGETIFIHKPDLVMEKWIGKCYRDHEVKEISGIENVAYLESFSSALNNKLIQGTVNKVYLDLERDTWKDKTTEPQDLAADIKIKYPDIIIGNIYGAFSELRMVKSKEEVDKIREAIRITWEGIKSSMKNAKPGMKECEIEAYFDFELKKNGVKDYAFKTIAAGGKNATVLHYTANDAEVKDGELMLMDLGAQYQYYNGDITRTFPVNGKFTERQKLFYNIVLKAQYETIKTIRAGINYKELNAVTRKVYLEELGKLGMVKTDEDVSKYYFHSVTHHLGLDTHDVGSRDCTLKPGMVLTMEPGLYIEEESIGIRIEDDVLVTEEGCEILSPYIPKTVEEIEEFLK
ncbi:aminopeptidase P family protein [Clostridium sp. 19966]|uniref:aminopeptidase P family protein n=1 Tax=Clostridium sp. 19966 TaxID=2768166 RepID=UPI0028DDFB14|nr:aminopeptidase P family protein [Clostridium sp. 19966]MDT8719622.1 aminopeptidase P family protein [Clostridium sp. 19966]